MIQQSHAWAYRACIQKRQKLEFKRYIHPNVHSNIIYNSQYTETA